MTEPRRTIFITGASSGIGKATALRMGKAGWNVALAARSMRSLKEICDELPDGQTLPLRCDVTDYDNIGPCLEQAHQKFGQINALFANAGIGGAPGGFSEAPTDSWRDIVNTNILGLAYTVQATLPFIKASKGHIIITGSVAGRRTLKGSMYSVSKHAANALAYNLREELAGTGCRVTLIEPGMVDTAFFDDPKPDALRPDDVARAVFYATDQPEHVEVGDLLIMPVAKAE